MSSESNRLISETLAFSDNPLVRLFAAVRRRTYDLAEPLSAEDQCIQSMPDTSPTKWHLAHVTWFFETFILKPHAPGYVEFHPDYNFLFNSYYEAVGPRHARPNRGLLSRPPLEEILAYRAHVDEAMAGFLEQGALERGEVATLLELGCHHEQQHQELLLTDIKHVFSCNPLKPVYHAPRPRDASRSRSLGWVEHPGGLVEIGHDGHGFAFDCEGPRHRVWLEPFNLASRPVTNGEYLEFMEDGGYARPDLWLSDGWAACRERGWDAPFYWEKQADDTWSIFTLAGLRPVDPDAPVCHVSFFEADAYARWAGKRLPTEAEWEIVAASLTPAGNFAGSREFHPIPARGDGLRQIYGDVWEWTGSAYLPYRGFQVAEGAVGEYNGKFMSGQMVLRGGSCATPEGHVRPTYRNFFYPADRWQFSGIRLAEDLSASRVQAPPLAETEIAAKAPADGIALDLLNDVVIGLSDTPKSLPSKWFYDAEGAAIFEEICTVPEYYPTRTERSILTASAPEIAETLGADAVLVEFGSGSMSKVRLLLDQMERPSTFVGIDISTEQLESAAGDLERSYPGLRVFAVAKDFTKPVTLPGNLGNGTRCAFFPGSTIGSFDPLEAKLLLERMRLVVGPGGYLLIGADTKKEEDLLEAAYNDASGAAARFNLNILRRINRDLGGDADLASFSHFAPYNDAKGRIEMHLRSERDQTLQVCGHAFHFEEGETIHTENSHKFTVEEFQALGMSAGFSPVQVWTDAENLFSVHLFQVT